MVRHRVLTLLYCSVSPIPFATMTNKEWGQIGNNYLKALFAIGFQGFLIMVCVGIYAVLVNNITVADNLHMILSRLVDTFSSRILYPMLILSGNHSIAVA